MLTLNDYIIANLNKPFKWGQADCVTFAIGWIDEVNGTDFLKRYGTWATRKQAMRAIRSAGGLENQFNKYLVSVNPNLANDGDIGLIGTTTHIFVGHNILSVSEEGLLFQTRTKAVRAWRHKGIKCPSL